MAPAPWQNLFGSFVFTLCNAFWLQSRDGKNANFSLSLVIVILIFLNRYLPLFTLLKSLVIVSYFIIIVISIVMSRVAPLMRVTYPHIFEIRLKSIEFDEKHMNLEILTIFYSHITRIFHYYYLFAYY